MIGSSIIALGTFSWLFLLVCTAFVEHHVASWPLILARLLMRSTLLLIACRAGLGGVAGSQLPVPRIAQMKLHFASTPRRVASLFGDYLYLHRILVCHGTRVIRDRAADSNGLPEQSHELSALPVLVPRPRIANCPA
jgi:hypothetical protein